MSDFSLCHREESFQYWKDDVAISVVGGNAEIAMSFSGRTRNDREGEILRQAQNERGCITLTLILSRSPYPSGSKSSLDACPPFVQREGEEICR